jgi:hypothetical protein
VVSIDEAMKALFSQKTKSWKFHVGINVAGRAQSNGVISRRVASGVQDKPGTQGMCVNPFVVKSCSDATFCMTCLVKRSAWGPHERVASRDQVDEQF